MAQVERSIENNGCEVVLKQKGFVLAFGIQRPLQDIEQFAPQSRCPGKLVLKHFDISCSPDTVVDMMSEE